MNESIIRIGASRSPDPETAVSEFHAMVAMPDAAAVFFFSSPDYDQAALAAGMKARFGDTPLFGCTTAGEIGPLGYLQGSLSGFSLSAAEFQVSAVCFENLENFKLVDAEPAIRSALAGLSGGGSPASPADTFGFLMIDGLSMREEIVSCALSGALNDIQFFGGSAGDGLNFRKTFVYQGGRFHDNGAVLSLIRTRRPFRVFQTQHFRDLAQKLVVTDADPSQRLVSEINGDRAAVEYAAAVGIAPEALGPDIFALHPVVVKINGKSYVRSIQKANPDGSLTFYCAIDVGVVLTVAESGDIVANLGEALAQIEKEIGTFRLVVGCDCILRNLELEQRGAKKQVAELMASHNFVGFSTYGEQLNSVHMNQTFTGVAIG